MTKNSPRQQVLQRYTKALNLFDIHHVQVVGDEILKKAIALQKISKPGEVRQVHSDYRQMPAGIYPFRHKGEVTAMLDDYLLKQIRKRGLHTLMSNGVTTQWVETGSEVDRVHFTVDIIF